MIFLIAAVQSIFLNVGLTTASLKESETMPDEREEFIRAVMEGRASKIESIF